MKEIEVTTYKVLKMIADWRYGDKPKNTREYEDIPVNERDNNSWWYLHGELQSFVHYDKATVTNCESGGFGVETINPRKLDGDQVEEIDEENPTCYMIHLDGIVEVEVEGIDKPCIGFFWTTKSRCYEKIYWKDEPYEWWEQRGLVCFKDDTEACKYAFQKYREKAQCL